MSVKVISKKSMTNIRETINKPKGKEGLRPYISTGSDLLDMVVGGGIGMGFPAGRIVNIVGDKSSGKTFIACELIAAAYNKYKKKLKWEYDDCESGFGFNTQALYGIEIMPEKASDRHHSDTVEDLYCNIRSFKEKLKAGELGIYVVDSLDGLSSEEGEKLANERYNAYQKEKEFKQGSYKMGKAKYLSQEFFPQLADELEDKNILLVIVSQVRENIDPMSFEKYTRTGGKAMDFYCYTVLWLAQVGKVTQKGRVTAVRVKVRTTKSKTPRPYREAYVSLIFDYGLDNISSNIDFLFDFLTPTGQIKKDAKASWSGNQQLTLDNLHGFMKQFWPDKTYLTTITRASLVKLIEGEGGDKVNSQFESEFMGDMKRAELISMVESADLESELTKRTVAKWEMIEASIKTNRKRKYADSK